MLPSASLVVLALAGAVWIVAARGHRARIAARRGLLDACADALDGPRLTHGQDGHPRLAGRHRGRPILVELIPDTLTIRRLPQLWLSVTLFAKREEEAPLVVLARPAGTEFYSLSSRFHRRVEPPEGWPPNIMVRGEGFNSQRLARRLAKPVGRILADPRVKEIAITARGLRILRQAAEGRRGDHLLLRQAAFDGAAVPRADLAGILDHLDGLRAASGSEAGVDSP